MRVFVSGALNSDSVGFMENIRKMLIMGREVEELGVRTYIPINDFLMSMVCGCLDHDHYYKCDLLELGYCDAMIVVPGYEDSIGVKSEMEHAMENGIPIFYTVDALERFLQWGEV